MPSDLEQVPALKNFLPSNGSLLCNEHTPLIAHTADDIVTSMTGLYPDRQGLGVSNSYLQYSPNSGATLDATSRRRSRTGLIPSAPATRCRT